ncbi:sulfotransferase [Streptomyces sp. NPDC058000]|uniref:sulfotransferase n=1 Tax=Streptomyces sp. NPDC058000 TaxID=3346299 RepID=UPI0036E58FCF
MNQAVHEEQITVLPGNWAPPGSRPVELVFRTVGERTSNLALDLALRHVQPQRAHVIRNVKPFARAVRRMLDELDHSCSHVVFVDADCLILEDLRPFLDTNDLPCVDAYGHDRFRRRIHCGARITRIDVVRAMAARPAPSDARGATLWPEGYLVGAVLRDLGLTWQYKDFHILHDHFQRYRDLFAKYALCQLRSRAGIRRHLLAESMARWGPEPEFTAARLGVQHAAATVDEGAGAEEIARYLRDLPLIAPGEVAAQGLTELDGEAGSQDVTAALAADPVGLAPPAAPFKVFGIGLPGTGTQSLNRALHVLGFSALHDAHPTARPLEEFPALRHYDGMTGATAAARAEELDRAWPGSKFVLTVRAQDHPDHVRRISAHFAARPDDLLVLDLAHGHGYPELAAFLGVPTPGQPFPHRPGRPTREVPS